FNDRETYLRRCSWPQKIANGTLTHPPVPYPKASRLAGKTAWALMTLKPKLVRHWRSPLPATKQPITRTKKKMIGANLLHGRNNPLITKPHTKFVSPAAHAYGR